MEKKKIIEMQDECIDNISNSIKELKDLVNETNKELKKQNDNLEKLDSDIDSINIKINKTQKDVNNLSGVKTTSLEVIDRNICDETQGKNNDENPGKKLCNLM